MEAAPFHAFSNDVSTILGQKSAHQVRHDHLLLWNDQRLVMDVSLRCLMNPAKVSSPCLVLLYMRNAPRGEVMPQDLLKCPRMRSPASM